MRNFRKNIIKILASVLCVVIFLQGINELGKFFYESAKDNIHLTCADLKETEGTIDTLLLGTSLMQVGMDAVTLGEELDSTCFNLASPAQPISGSYVLLKDMIKRNPLKRVFWGGGVNSFVGDSKGRSLTAKVKTLKLIQSYLGKAEFLLRTANADELEPLIFCPARVDNTLNFEYIKKNVKYKLSQDFKERIPYPTAEFHYYGMGTEGKEKSFSGKYNKKVPLENVWDRERLVESSLSYIRKMAELCRKNGVEFNIVIFPHAECLIPQQGDLADMDAFLEEFAEENGIGLYNYNVTMCPDIYELLPDTSYADVKHVNHTGALTMTHLLAEDYKKDGEVSAAE